MDGISRALGVGLITITVTLIVLFIALLIYYAIFCFRKDQEAKRQLRIAELQRLRVWAPWV